MTWMIRHVTSNLYQMINPMIIFVLIHSINWKLGNNFLHSNVLSLHSSRYIVYFLKRCYLENKIFVARGHRQLVQIFQKWISISHDCLMLDCKNMTMFEYGLSSNQIWYQIICNKIAFKIVKVDEGYDHSQWEKSYIKIEKNVKKQAFWGDLNSRLGSQNQASLISNQFSTIKIVIMLRDTAAKWIKISEW